MRATLCLGGAERSGCHFHTGRGNAGIVFNGVINLPDVVKRRKLKVHRFLLCHIKAFFNTNAERLTFVFN